MNSFIKKLLSPLFFLKHKQEEWLRRNCPEKFFAYCYYRTTGLHLNLRRPKTLYDKIAYLAFKTDTGEWSRLADKVKVRDYLKECGLEDYLPSVYGIWEKSSDIPFESLPDSFVLKTNHASATNILVKDKSAASLQDIRKQLDEWLNIDYGYLTGQPHYSKIKPLILAEEYLHADSGELSLTDYKFYCSSGLPLCVFVYTERVPNTHEAKRTIYDMDWHEHPEYLSKRHVFGPTIKKPISFETMSSIARVLSRPFPFVRVDLYEIKGRPVFGEMTFTPDLGEPSKEFLLKLGEKVHLPCSIE